MYSSIIFSIATFGVLKFYSGYKKELFIFLIVICYLNFCYLNYYYIGYNFESLFVYIFQILYTINYNLLLLLLILMYISLNKNQFFENVWVFGFWYIIYHYINNMDYSILTYLSIPFNNLFKINERLINGLFIIHPILMYIFYVIFIYFIFYYNYIIVFNFVNIYKKLIKMQEIYTYIYILYIFSGLALIYGAWWAQQEINWNGWWGWDFVEIVNLLFVLICLFWLHKKKNQTSLYKHTHYALYFLILGVFCFSSIRFGLFNSIHSFLNVNMMQQYFYIINFFLFFFIGINLKKLYIRLYIWKNCNKINLLLVYWSLTIGSLCIFIGVIYILYILNQFFWFFQFISIRFLLFILIYIYIFGIDIRFGISIFHIFWSFFFGVFEGLYLLFFKNFGILFLSKLRITTYFSHLYLSGFVVCLLLTNFNYDYVLWQEWSYDFSLSDLFKYSLAYMVEDHLNLGVFFSEIYSRFFVEKLDIIRNIDYLVVNKLVVYMNRFELFVFSIYIKNYFFLYIGLCSFTYCVLNNGFLKKKSNII